MVELDDEGASVVHLCLIDHGIEDVGGDYRRHVIDIDVRLVPIEVFDGLIVDGGHFLAEGLFEPGLLVVRDVVEVDELVLAGDDGSHVRWRQLGGLITARRCHDVSRLVGNRDVEGVDGVLEFGELALVGVVVQVEENDRNVSTCDVVAGKACLLLGCVVRYLLDHLRKGVDVAVNQHRFLGEAEAEEGLGGKDRAYD